MKAYELLDKPEKWTKGAIARDSYGDEVVDEIDQEAVCWCLVGAIHKCYPDEAFNIIHVASVKTGIPSFPTWQDAPERTYEEVVALLKELNI